MLPFGLMSRVVIPTAMRKNTVIIGISSKAVAEDSPMNMLMNAKYLDTGEQIFKVRVFTKRCAMCVARNVMQCNHRVEVSWSSQQQARKIAALMRSDQHAFRAEILNEDVESTISRAFPESLLNGFVRSEYVIPRGIRIKQLFVGIDPSAGGNRSKFAIVTVAYVPRPGPVARDRVAKQTQRHIDTVVVAADFSDAREPEDHNSLLIRHIEMLRDTPEFQHARIVICPENNMRFEALNLKNEVRRNFDSDTCIVLNEGCFNVGVRSDNATKQAMAEGFVDDLRQEHIHLWKNFLSAEALRVFEQRRHQQYAPAPTDRHRNNDMRQVIVEEVRDELCKELATFKRIVEPPKDRRREAKITYSGKGEGGCDDLVMALLVGNLSSKLFFSHDEYKAYY